MSGYSTTNYMLDRMALCYSLGEDSKLIDLYETLRGFIRREARKASCRAIRYGLFIPVEDFESLFNQALWESAKGYDGRTHYMQRFRTYLERAEADVWRRYRNINNGEVTYAKARIMSIDTVINDEGDTLGDVIMTRSAFPGFEEDLVGGETVLQAIEEFSMVNNSYGSVIKLLASGQSGRALASHFGEKEYGSKLRILVYRARKSFMKFLDEKYKGDLFYA